MTHGEKSCEIFIVATPIGNLGDISARAIATLKAADVIAAEDTRNTRKLLSHFDIVGKDLVSYHDHGESAKSEQLVDRIERDQLTLAIVSDAGTPCVADPGYRLVQLAKERGIPVRPIPGPSALTCLISASGLPSDRVLFVGFLPTKDSELRQEIHSWLVTRASVVFFESTRRLLDSLDAIASIHPDAKIAVGRELTKIYEEIKTGTVTEIKHWAAAHQQFKGEAVVMVSLSGLQQNVAQNNDELREKVIATATQGFRDGKSLKDLLKELGAIGLPRSELYDMLLQIKQATQSGE